jgi:hypothetical protein
MTFERKVQNGISYIEMEKAPVEEMQKLRGIVMDNWTTSENYKAKEKAHPFVQGYNEEEGWIFIEFWSSDLEAIEKYIQYLNEKMKG